MAGSAGRGAVLRRIAMWSLILVAAYFAIQGGEYSTVSLIRQRTLEQDLTRAIDSLEQEVDSLRRLRRRIANDPAFQERIAREQNGMVRSDKELMYRFVEPGRARP